MRSSTNGRLARLVDHGVVVGERLPARAPPGPPHRPGPIDDEDGPARHSRVTGHIVAPHAVVRHHLALEITDEVVGETPQLFGERLVGEHGVDTDGIYADAVSGGRLIP